MIRAGVVAAAVVAVVASAGPASADTVVGSGTPESCTSRAVVLAVAAGGRITFDCGPEYAVIEMERTAEVSTTSERVVLDGGGRVALDGQGRRRILSMDTCDRARVRTTSRCDGPAQPRLVVRGMRLQRGDATGTRSGGGGGGAIFVRGGRLTIVDSVFDRNRCDRTGSDVAGAAIRVVGQHRDRPVRVIRSHFQHGDCSNGGALSSTGASWRIDRSTFTSNDAEGRGGDPARPGTPGGGSGGAVHMVGNGIHLTVDDSVFSNNEAREDGAAILFVSHDRSGTLTIRGSRLYSNLRVGRETLPGIVFLGGRRTITNSVVCCAS